MNSLTRLALRFNLKSLERTKHFKALREPRSQAGKSSITSEHKYFWVIVTRATIFGYILGDSKAWLSNRLLIELFKRRSSESHYKIYTVNALQRATIDTVNKDWKLEQH